MIRTMRDETVPFTRGLPAYLVVAPAMMLAIALVVFEGASWVSQSARDLGDLSDASFAEALRQDDMARAFRFIRAGRDPNTPVVFRDEVLTGGQDIRIAPLLIAVASDRDDSVGMLMGFGVHLDAPGNRFAACLATRLGYAELAAVIMKDGGPAVSSLRCPDASPSPEAPLLAYVE